MATPYLVGGMMCRCDVAGHGQWSNQSKDVSDYVNCRFVYAVWCPTCGAQRGFDCDSESKHSGPVDSSLSRIRTSGEHTNNDRTRVLQPSNVTKMDEYIKGVAKNGHLPSVHSSRNPWGKVAEKKISISGLIPEKMDIDGSDSENGMFFSKGDGKRQNGDGKNWSFSEKCVQVFENGYCRQYKDMCNKELSDSSSCDSVNRCQSNAMVMKLVSDSSGNVSWSELENDSSHLSSYSHDHYARKSRFRHNSSSWDHSKAAACHPECDRRSPRLSPLRDIHARSGDSKSIEGKRLRQKSESDAVFSVGLDVWSEPPKRPRDLSPNLLLSEGHKTERVNGMLKSALTTPKHRDLRLQHSDASDYERLQESQGHKAEVKFKQKLSGGDTDSEVADSDAYVTEDEEEEEEETSNPSEATLKSAGLDTPLAVGESIGSISLADKVKENKDATQTVQKRDPVVEPYPIRRYHVPPMTKSLFAHVPPWINFCMHDEKADPLPQEVQRLLRWKLSTITPVVVRRTLVNSGFKLVRKGTEWAGTWGKHMKSVCFKTIKDFQKINHLPGTFQIGRKDRLWKNLQRLMAKFGRKEFGFIPRTYILPQDNKMLRTAWEKGGNQKWIIKPPASARGAGIKVVHRWSQVPKKRPVIVQKYIGNPYLINGNKFDLRLYVFVSSINPLRIYIYDDGLVRFASVKYSSDMRSLSDRYMHLTNYSINKNSSLYTQNEDASACQGHKWTLKSLWQYLSAEGVDVSALWDSLVDVVVKTVISGESSIAGLSRAHVTSRYSCYELFGIDILLDEELKPWLLEVNISPSLHFASPLDIAVKGPLVRDLFNMARFHVPNKLSTSQQNGYLGSLNLGKDTTSLCFDKRIYTTSLSRDERLKHQKFQLENSRAEYLDGILEKLTPDDVRHLIQYEDEISQAGRFVRIFPTADSHNYHPFFEVQRYYNLLFDAWETRYSNRRQDGIRLLQSLCQKKVHLEVPVCAVNTKLSTNQTNDSSENVKLPAPLNGFEKSPYLEKLAKPQGICSPVRQRPTSGRRVVSKPLIKTGFGSKRLSPRSAVSLCSLGSDTSHKPKNCESI